MKTYNEICFVETNVHLIGIGDLAQKVIEGVKSYNIRRTNYNHFNSNDELINDYFQNLNKNDVIIYISQVNDELTYNAILNVINQNKKNNNILNLAYLSGDLVDSNLIDKIFENNVTTIKSLSLEKTISSISYLTGLINIPGYIGLDAIDVSTIFKDKRESIYETIESDSILLGANDLCEKICKLVDQNYIADLIVIFDGGKELKVNDLPEGITEFRKVFPREYFDILFGTQSLKKNNGYQLSVFVSIDDIKLKI